jgi:hypothetical protein
VELFGVLASQIPSFVELLPTHDDRTVT